ncbi:unnamed protein product, partial [Coregonus sp. 'balchen']
QPNHPTAQAPHSAMDAPATRAALQQQWRWELNSTNIMLNVRFAGYIGHFQTLEQRNAQLQVELDDLKGRYKGGPSGIGEERRVEVDIERGYIEEEVEELALWDEAEMILTEFQQNVDNTMLQRADLEWRVEKLMAEIQFLKKLHDKEVADLLK